MKDKHKVIKLDDYEQEIEDALARDEYVEVEDLEESKKMFVEAAKNFEEMRKSKQVTIRVNNEDLIKVKAKAEKSKIPYQTLINLLIHQYARGETRLRI